ncbi:MAG: putative beta-barrel protein YwiB [Firmicutes bacterium ADurb.Bin193]|nr:MAG: putative beta-barrel protein YwiB [Firmicutes bacterium ADurb.Bin193]
MKKDVIISLRGRQSDKDGNEEIELVTEGIYYKDNESHYVTYNETEVTGMEGTTTTLKIEKGRVTMLRSGQNNSQLIFEKGERHLCCYETPFGAFTIGVLSNRVDIDINDKGGDVSAEYRIEIDNNISGSNDFHLHFREC